VRIDVRGPPLQAIREQRSKIVVDTPSEKGELCSWEAGAKRLEEALQQDEVPKCVQTGKKNGCGWR